MGVQEKLASVTDEASFLEFVRALLADRLHAERGEARKKSSSFGFGASDWENTTISSFLGAAIAWAEDSSFGSTQGLSPVRNPWHAFAVFLYCGKIYE